MDSDTRQFTTYAERNIKAALLSAHDRLKITPETNEVSVSKIYRMAKKLEEEVTLLNLRKGIK